MCIRDRFYGGMVRKKNVGDTVMTSFAVTCLVTILFAVITYSLAFTPGSPFIGGTTRAFLHGILSVMSNGNSDAMFKVLDFAGGTVVHINAGVAGLMCAICLGKRKDMGPPHNMVLTFIGASMLWVGWFGFNAGSAVTAGMQAGMAMTVTQIATAVAGFTWMLVEWICRGKPTVIGICSGAVAGLVAITPASGFVGPMGAFWIGVAAGIVCYWGVTGLKHFFGYDDALDVFG